MVDVWVVAKVALLVLQSAVGKAVPKVASLVVVKVDLMVVSMVVM